MAEHELDSAIKIGAAQNNVIQGFRHAPGHESPITTHMYLEADLQMKQRALKTLRVPKNAPVRYRPPDRLLQFLQGL
jgi:hypothetical protein